jgi:NAD+ kinase
MKLFEEALVVYKPVEGCLKLAGLASTVLRTYGVDTYTITVDDLYNKATYRGEAPRFDLVVSIGGDGTFMKSAKCAGYTSLILPYPCGKRNAYYEHGLQGIDRVVERVLNGDFYLEYIPLYSMCVEESCRIFINDAVVASVDLGKVAKFRVNMESNVVKTSIFFEGDGVIVASSYGSSGHSLSAGGPIVIPEHESLVITPLNPLQTGIKSLVAPPYSKVVLWAKNPAHLYTDGDYVALLKGGNVIRVEHSHRYLKVIRFSVKRDTWRAIIEPRQCVF